MIRTVIVGGGMVGLTLARLLRARRHEPVVLERSAAGAYQPRGFMLGYQGFEAFEELGILARLRAAGRDVGVGPNGVPIGVAVDVGEVMRALAEGVPVAHGESVVELVRDDGRVAGVVTEGPGGRATVPADLVVACDGRGSPVRGWAGLEARLHPLNDACLSFLSPLPTRRLFGFRYLTDGGMITMLGWPQGGTASRRIDGSATRGRTAGGSAGRRRARRRSASGRRDGELEIRRPVHDPHAPRAGDRLDAVSGHDIPGRDGGALHRRAPGARRPRPRLVCLRHRAPSYFSPGTRRHPTDGTCFHTCNGFVVEYRAPAAGRVTSWDVGTPRRAGVADDARGPQTAGVARERSTRERV